MSNPEFVSPLEAAIADLIQKSTFSVDALAGIQALKDKARQLGMELDQTKREVLRLKPDADRTREADVMMKDAQNKLALSIAEQMKLDMQKQVAHARAETYKECFELVFRNTLVRSNVFGSTSFPNKDGYGTVSGPINEDRTTEVK